MTSAVPNNTKIRLSEWNELQNRANDQPRFILVKTLKVQESGNTRLNLERIALDTKAASEDRMQALCDLGAIATKESVPMLLDILETDLDQRRGFWACAIPVIESLNDRRAIPLLSRIANLREEHLAGMDHMAIEALAKIGDEREVSLLNSKAYIVPVRHSVIKGLSRIGSIQSADILISALQEEDEPETIKTAEAGLLKINRAAIPALRKALQETPEGWNKSYRSRIKKIITKIQQ